MISGAGPGSGKDVTVILNEKEWDVFDVVNGSYEIQHHNLTAAMINAVYKSFTLCHQIL